MFNLSKIRGVSYDLTLLKGIEKSNGALAMLRLGVVVFVTLVLWLANAPSHLIIDILIYAVLSVAHTLIVAAMPVRITAAQVALLFLSRFTVGLAWSHALIYLWLSPDPNLRVLALVSLYWWMIYAMTVRRNDLVMTRATMASMAVALFGMPAVSWLIKDNTVEAVILLISNMAGFVYYIKGIQDVSVMRKKLNLAQASAIEQSKNEALGRLTGGVAHDFNNLLTVISGNLELVDEIDDPAERRVILSEASLAAKRAAKVTAQLLAYSRRAKMEVQQFDVNSSLIELRSLMVRLLPSTIALTSTRTGHLNTIVADKSQFDSTILNLCINARDAMPKGGRIQVRIMNEAVPEGAYQTSAGVLPAGQYLRIEVEDDGNGMSPDVLSHVFEPYFTTKPKGQGSGLGLSMARGFAEQSGGMLTVTSEPGVGTIAVLMLPAVLVDEQSAFNPQIAAAPA